MIAGQQGRQRRRRPVERAVLEFRSLGRPQRQVVVEGEFSERHYDPDALEPFKFLDQESPAVQRLLARRLVIGRRAAHRGGDVAIAQAQPVVAFDGLRLAGKSGAIERVEKIFAAAVAGEHASRAVRSVRAGRESENQEPRPRIAKRRDRLRPVIPFPISSALHLRDARAVLR